LFDPLVFPIFVVFCQVLAGTGIVRLAGDIQVALAVYRYGAGSGEACNGLVQTFTVYDGKLIVGGDFTTAGGIEANHIAAWDGSSWSDRKRVV